jgi:hypothetical protein
MALGVGGVGAATEKVRILNGGSVLIGATAAVGSEKCRVNGDIYVDANCSALSFTDRTPFPESPAVAWAAIKSMKSSGKGGVNHAALHDFVRAESKRITKGEDGKDSESVELGRNMSASLSAAIACIQDLSAENDALKERIAKLEKAA